MYIRSLFDANKNVRDPRQQKVSLRFANSVSWVDDLQRNRQVLLQETERLLETWKHPDAYRPPTAPGGKS